MKKESSSKFYYIGIVLMLIGGSVVFPIMLIYGTQPNAYIIDGERYENTDQITAVYIMIPFAIIFLIGMSFMFVGLEDYSKESVELDLVKLKELSD